MIAVTCIKSFIIVEYNRQGNNSARIPFITGKLQGANDSAKIVFSRWKTQ